MPGDPAGCGRGHVVGGGVRGRGERSPQKAGSNLLSGRRYRGAGGAAVGARMSNRGRRVSGRRRRSGCDSRWGRARARTLARGGGRAPRWRACAKVAPRRAALLTAAAHPRPRCPPMQAHNRGDGRTPPGCRHARSIQGRPWPWPVAGAMPRRSMTWQPGSAPPLLPTHPAPHPPLAQPPGHLGVPASSTGRGGYTSTGMSAAGRFGQSTALLPGAPIGPDWLVVGTPRGRAAIISCGGLAESRRLTGGAVRRRHQRPNPGQQRSRARTCTTWRAPPPPGARPAGHRRPRLGRRVDRRGHRAQAQGVSAAADATSRRRRRRWRPTLLMPAGASIFSAGVG